MGRSPLPFKFSVQYYVQRKLPEPRTCGYEPWSSTNFKEKRVLRCYPEAREFFSNLPYVDTSSFIQSSMLGLLSVY